MCQVPTRPPRARLCAQISLALDELQELPVTVREMNLHADRRITQLEERLVDRIEELLQPDKGRGRRGSFTIAAGGGAPASPTLPRSSRRQGSFAGDAAQEKHLQIVKQIQGK